MTDLAGVSDYAPEQLHLVPAHLRPSLRAYLEDGRPTGDALWHVLANQPVRECVGRLDDEALAGLRGLIVYLYNYAPAASWGSPEQVEAWGALGGLRGRLAGREQPA